MLITESRFVGRLCAPHITKDPYDKVGGASFQRKKINSINLEIVEQYEYTDCVPSKWHEPYIQQELLKVKDAGVNISFLLVVGRLGVHNPLTFCVMGLRRPRLMLDD